MISIRLEALAPSALQVEQVSVNLQAHWRKCRSLQSLQSLISSSLIRYMGRISSMPEKLLLCSLGIMVCTWAP